MAADFEIPLGPLSTSHLLHTYLANLGLLEQRGCAIHIEQAQFKDAERLLQRRRIESFCDWFTVIGGIRSGLL